MNPRHPERSEGSLRESVTKSRRTPSASFSSLRRLKMTLLAFGCFILTVRGTPLNVTFSPSRPTVGDIITLTLPRDVQQVAINPSPEYEVLTGKDNRVTLRSFKPGPLTIGGKLTRDPGLGTRDFAMNLTITSVLQPNDTLEPAELKPPVPLPPSRVARGALAAAAAAALISWAAVFLLARGTRDAAAPTTLSAREEFRVALTRAERIRDPNQKLIHLADATRTYLSRTLPSLRRELTTFELLRVLDRDDVAASVRELLTAADLAKFSPWGADQRDYGFLVERLGRLPDAIEPAVEAA